MSERVKRSVRDEARHDEEPLGGPSPDGQERALAAEHVVAPECLETRVDTNESLDALSCFALLASEADVANARDVHPLAEQAALASQGLDVPVSNEAVIAYAKHHTLGADPRSLQETLAREAHGNEDSDPQSVTWLKWLATKVLGRHAAASSLISVLLGLYVLLNAANLVGSLAAPTADLSTIVLFAFPQVVLFGLFVIKFGFRVRTLTESVWTVIQRRRSGAEKALFPVQTSMETRAQEAAERLLDSKSIEASRRPASRGSFLAITKAIAWHEWQKISGRSQLTYVFVNVGMLLALVCVWTFKVRATIAATCTVGLEPIYRFVVAVVDWPLRLIGAPAPTADDLDALLRGGVVPGGFTSADWTVFSLLILLVWAVGPRLFQGADYLWASGHAADALQTEAREALNRLRAILELRRAALRSTVDFTETWSLATSSLDVTLFRAVDKRAVTKVPTQLRLLLEGKPELHLEAATDASGVATFTLPDDACKSRITSGSLTLPLGFVPPGLSLQPPEPIDEVDDGDGEKEDEEEEVESTVRVVAHCGDPDRPPRIAQEIAEALLALDFTGLVGKPDAGSDASLHPRHVGECSPQEMAGLVLLLVPVLHRIPSVHARAEFGRVRFGQRLVVFTEREGALGEDASRVLAERTSDWCLALGLLGLPAMELDLRAKGKGDATKRRDTLLKFLGEQRVDVSTPAPPTGAQRVAAYRAGIGALGKAASRWTERPSDAELAATAQRIGHDVQAALGGRSYVAPDCAALTQALKQSGREVTAAAVANASAALPAATGVLPPLAKQMATRFLGRLARHLEEVGLPKLATYSLATVVAAAGTVVLASQAPALLVYYGAAAAIALAASRIPAPTPTATAPTAVPGPSDITCDVWPLCYGIAFAAFDGTADLDAALQHTSKLHRSLMAETVQRCLEELSTHVTQGASA